MSNPDLFDAGFLLSCLWVVTLFLGPGALLSWLARRRSAQAHQILVLALLAGVVAPVGSFVVRQCGWGVLEPSMPVAISPVVSASRPPSNHDLPAGLRNVDARTGQDPSRGAWVAVVVWTWISVSGLLLLLLGLKFITGLRVLARARPLVNEHIHGYLEEAVAKVKENLIPIAFTSQHVRCPSIWCWGLHPVLLLPPSLVDNPGSTNWSAVFRHELAHLARRDHMASILVEIVCCVLFWHPFVWWIRRRLYLLSDQACDEWAIFSGEPAVGYAEALLSLVPGRRSLTALAMVSTKKSLKSRLENILDRPPENPALRSGRTYAALALTAALATAVSYAQPGRPVLESPFDDPNNLVANAGMEHGGSRPDHWVRERHVEGVEYVWDRETAHSGKASLRLDKRVNRYSPIAQWRQELRLPPLPREDQLEVSAWVKADQVTKAILDVQFVDRAGAWRHQWAAGIIARKIHSAPVHHDWKKYSGNVDIPSGTVKVYVGLQIYGPGTVWFDDVSATYVVK